MVFLESEADIGFGVSFFLLKNVQIYKIGIVFFEPEANIGFCIVKKSSTIQPTIQNW